MLGMGTVIAIMDGPQTHQCVRALIQCARVYATMPAYTWDSDMLTTEMCTAHTDRSVLATVCFDAEQTLEGRSMLQIQRMRRLRRAGVTTVVRGRNSGGDEAMQHTKVLVTDGKRMVAGSTNWTRNSQRATELSILLEVSPEGRPLVEAWCTRLLSGAVPVTDAMLRAGEQSATRFASQHDNSYRAAGQQSAPVVGQAGDRADVPASSGQAGPRDGRRLAAIYREEQRRT